MKQKLKGTIIYRILKKFYYFYYIGGVVRSLLQGFYVQRIEDKNSVVINQLLQRIKIAQQNKQKIYVQLPLCPWNWMLQRPQQLAIAMEKKGYLVIYFSPINTEGFDFVTIISQNLYVTDHYSLLQHLKDAIITKYITYPSYIDRYLTSKLYSDNAVVCEYVDHVSEEICGKYLESVVNQRLLKLHKKDYRRIIATSQILYDELKNKFKCSNVSLIPNGVDVSHYNDLPNLNSDVIDMPTPLVEAIASGKTIIGYFGAIAPWIWDEILLALADQRSDYFLLLLGPVYGDRGELAKRENICCPGVVEYKFLPYYAKHFDVSIIPFRLGDIAKTTSPLKLFEYFAIGQPIVVTSDLVECTKYDGVFVASDAEDFITKIDAAVDHKNDKELKKRYLQYAIDNSWTQRCHDLINNVYNNAE